MDSILLWVEKSLGIAEDDHHFDPDIIAHINSAFKVLKQLGVGPAKGFAIMDETAVWSDFIEDSVELAGVMSYMYAKVKLIFDPPLSATHKEALKETVNEFEWRLNLDAETDLAPKDVEIDYNKLSNKPSINGQPLVGNFDEQDPNVKHIESSDIDAIFNEVFKD
jgi:hypothetical protein